MSGEYTPKYKVGETSLYIDYKGQEIFEIIIGTYRSIQRFSDELREERGYDARDVGYDERDADHTLYFLYKPANNSVVWRYEHEINLYCINRNRGKNILRREDAFNKIVRHVPIKDPVEFFKTLSI